ncbi:efflux RND transporter permease subunit [uncultured Microbulbifer sp.]|uniref:efflux RND transporter permease subunit n=1 Tax=uncultured Microbulbifer sp. TaxID=348147 RepID=UPI00261AACC9|nr:efflux RND transporter permease subunit [uncultured Microbulbifer sp.]
MKTLEKYSSIIISCTFSLIIAGIIAGLNLPNALLPTIKRPQIALATSWPGKTAEEIEQILIAPLEQELSGLSYLKEVQTNINSGLAWTTVDFHSEADMEQMYIEVLSRINQVPNWPTQVRTPQVFNFSNGAGATLASFFLYSKKSASELELIDAFINHIKPAFSKVPGVSSIEEAGTPIARRVDIEFAPEKMAQNSLSIAEVTAQLSNLVDRSGGNLKIGSKDYALHFKGQIPLGELSQIPITSRGNQIIRLSDIASVKARTASDWAYFALEGNRSFYFYLLPTENVNVLETITQLKSTMGELNSGELRRLGMELAISRDDSKGIRSSLNLVYGSLLLGSLLACLVLFWFLRNFRTLTLIFLSIPVCISLVVLGMYLGGRSMNVVSLAGIALSIGLMVDAAIIVMENIQRLRFKGFSIQDSIINGTREVTGSLASSTISSVIVFVPIITMQSATGQLFRDLAFTISSALLASLLFALIILPSLARYLLGKSTTLKKNSNSATIDTVLRKWVDLSMRAASDPKRSIAVIILGLPIALIATYLSTPSIDVLPDPKQNMVSVYINFENPLSTEIIKTEIGERVVNRITTNMKEIEDQVSTYGIICNPNNCNLYLYTHGDWSFKTLQEWLNKKVLYGLIGTQVHFSHNGLLRFAMPNNRISQLDIKGAELSRLQEAGVELMNYLHSEFPEAQIREGSALQNRAVRIEFQPRLDQLTHLGITISELNRHLMALTDGIYIGHFYTGTNTLPFYLKAKEPQNLQTLLDTEIFIESHGMIPVRELTEAQITQAPGSILRVGQEVSASLNLTPPEGVAMKSFTEDVDQSVKSFLATSPYNDLHTQFRGSANELNLFLGEFLRIFLAALVVLSLLMYFALRSAKLAAAVLCAIPLAFTGGMLSLQILNVFTPQSLDVITMIGFVILMGLVVNNSILLVNQFQLTLQNGAGQFEAIQTAARLRIRPIMLTTITCIFGNLPLVFNPGSSAAIYRGLATVITGGMLFSALFVLAFMSALLSLKIFKPETPNISHRSDQRFPESHYA